ncbi:MAG TPA: glycerophosphodiester phosphodiesterase, partial [Planctomycetota bacterium]|nr:glycerophosphodiester phosphodiesterase [Planctomycetota bacterium]
PLVNALRMEDLAKLDAGSWKSPKFRGEPIPTFEQALELLRGRAVPVVEIKEEHIGEEVAKVIEKLGMEHEVFVQSFKAQAIEDVKRVLPGVATGFLTGERISADPRARAEAHVAAARRAGANAVVCHYELAEPEYVRELERRGVTLWVYTVNDESLWDGLIRIGVDGLISDVPERLVPYVKERSRLEPVASR